MSTNVFHGLRRHTGRAARVIGERPTLLLTPLEPPRAVAESAGLTAAMPALLATAGKADGHPVLVVPGLSGGAVWCLALRRFLTAAGHDVHQPERFATKGSLPTVARRLVEQVRTLADRHDQRVTLIGWSVGGCLTRQVGLLEPHHVRQVITLGAPSGGRWYAGVPGTSDRPMPVPTTSIYSRSDPYFNARACRQPAAPRCEDVEVSGSHLGLASNPLSYHVIADRLSRPVDRWTPYVSPRTRVGQAVQAWAGQSRST